MRRRWLASGFLAACLVVLVAGSALGGLVLEWGDYIWSEGDLELSGSMAASWTRVGCYSMYYPADFELIAGLYKGDRYVGQDGTGVIPECFGHKSFRYPENGYKSSSYEGSWQAYAWQWGEDLDVPFEESLTTYDPPLDERSMLALTARHRDVMPLVAENGASWLYCIDVGPEARAVLGDSKAVALDVMYRTGLFPAEMRTDDYFPFLLVGREGGAAKAVFPKADGSVRVVQLAWADKAWNVECTRTLR